MNKLANKLELNTKIISNFKAEINGCIVNNEDVYYTVSDILEYIINTDIPFTKYKDFVIDLIETLEVLKGYGSNKEYAHVESVLKDITIKLKNIDELTDAISNLIENEIYVEFTDMYNKLKNNYYIS